MQNQAVQQRLNGGRKHGCEQIDARYINQSCSYIGEGTTNSLLNKNPQTLLNKGVAGFLLSLDLFPLASQIHLWCLKVANRSSLLLISALKCAVFSPVSLVSECMSSFWPHDLSSHDGENKAF